MFLSGYILQSSLRCHLLDIYLIYRTPHTLVVFDSMLGSILSTVVGIDRPKFFHQVSPVRNTQLLYYPTKYVAKLSFHVYCALVVMLKAGLNLPMIFCALDCRNRSTFQHLSRLDAKNLFSSVWQAIFHKWFFAFRCLFPSIYMESTFLPFGSFPMRVDVRKWWTVQNSMLRPIFSTFELNLYPIMLANLRL